MNFFLGLLNDKYNLTSNTVRYVSEYIGKIKYHMIQIFHVCTWLCLHNLIE